MSVRAYKSAQFAYHGLIKLNNRFLNRIDPPVVILIYHRVTTLLSDPQQLAVSPENFRAQLRFLKDNFPIVRFEEDWSTIKKPAVAITFDDGYADNAREALPILEEVGVPATFFVSTGNIGSRREFWWDELERIILGDWPFPESFTLIDTLYGRSWPTATVEERQALYQEIHPLIKKVGAGQRESWLVQLQQWAQAGETGREAYRPMTVAELQELANSRWATIGAHTVSHSPLSSLSEQEQREEIFSSRQQLETLLGRKIEVFSYPFGTKHDYDDNSVRLVRDAGFVKTAANFRGQAHGWTDSCQLPRQLVRNWEIDTFSAMIQKFWVL